MKTEDNKSLMRMARESLKGKWGLAIGGLVVYCLVVGIVEAVPKVGGLASIFIAGPMMGGLAVFSLAISRNQEVKIEQLFQGFNRFGTYLGAYWLMILFIVLWSLGISEALKKSKEIMSGHKWKYFCLAWRFFGWFLLCLLSLGIGFFWLFPYMQISFAKFYEDLKSGQKFNTLDADV